jgi:8-oxo-dGTP pyrophosphatase MutT (NUDIX family)
VVRLREYSAAGGVVLDDAGKVLLLERWIQREAGLIHEIRLPKGHVEPGETDEQAALRETCEESGYCGLDIVADLGHASVEWTNSEEHVVRQEHYYLMRLTAARGQPEFHSADEAKFRVTWGVDLAEAERRLTYGSEKEFASRARAYLASQPERG